MRPLQGYPTSIGSRVLSVFGHAGPTSYTQVTTAPVAGGDSVSASDGGLKFVDSVIGGITDDGLYRVEAIPAGTDDDANAPQGSSTMRLRWTVVATGAQVGGAVDLSASVVRLTAIGF